MLVADFTESSLLSRLRPVSNVYERVPDDSSPTRIKRTGPLAWWLVFGLSCLGLKLPRHIAARVRKGVASRHHACLHLN